MPLFDSITSAIGNVTKTLRFSTPKPFPPTTDDKEKAKALSVHLCSTWKKQSDLMFELTIINPILQQTELRARKHSLTAGLKRIFADLLKGEELTKEIESALLKDLTHAELDAIYTLCQTESGRSALLKISSISDVVTKYTLVKVTTLQPQINKLLSDEIQGKISLQSLVDTVIGTAAEKLSSRPSL